MNIDLEGVTKIRRQGETVKEFAPGAVGEGPVDEDSDEEDKKADPCCQATYNDFDFASPHASNEVLYFVLVKCPIGVAYGSVLTHAGDADHAELVLVAIAEVWNKHIGQQYTGDKTGYVCVVVEPGEEAHENADHQENGLLEDNRQRRNEDIQSLQRVY